ncbi:MAG: hypothetical protein LBJ39_02595, partial [Tannerellaceae bacterium]|nr:hypothetical protein [Tannerellaceae bacterium]
GVDFGYLWWIDNNRDIVYMWGHGGQFVFINKTKALLVVIKSETGDAELKLNQGLSIYDWINGITY